MTVATDRVREILADAEIDGLHLRLPRQLDRKDYTAVDKVLTALGGKWTMRVQAHVFPVDPTEKLREFLAGGQAPKPARTTEGYVATPTELADWIVHSFTAVDDLPDGARVLEPSAGDGQLVRAILRLNPAVEVVAVEPNAVRAGQIGEGPQVDLRVETLEEFAAATDERFEIIVMNPPFAMPGQATAWIDHVNLAWELLAPHGALVAIVPNGFLHREDRRHQAMRDLVGEHGGLYKLPDDAFASSGTTVRTVVIWLDKPEG